METGEQAKSPVQVQHKPKTAVTNTKTMFSNKEAGDGNKHSNKIFLYSTLSAIWKPHHIIEKQASSKPPHKKLKLGSHSVVRPKQSGLALMWWNVCLQSGHFS